jgi:RNA polymerase sigma factor for flagellar operon FliA
VRRAREALERDLGRAPHASEIAAVTGHTPAAVAQFDRLALAAQACSADETDAHGEQLHALVDSEAACPARSAESVDAHSSVRAALDRLPPNHARVLRRYYLEDATLDDIAAEFGVSKERIRQLREAAEKKLREDFVVLALWQAFLTRR